MAWPHIFANLSGSVPASYLDDNFNAAALETDLLALSGTVTALQTQVNAIVTRPVLTGNRTYFVATTGSDSNNGLTVGAPFLTVQKAINVAQSLDFSGFTVTIQIADGTYAGNVTVTGVAPGQLTAAQLLILGNIATPANVVFSFATGSSPTIAVSQGSMVKIRGIRFTGASQALISSSSNSYVEFDTCDFAGNTAHLATSYNGIIAATGNYTISGGGTLHAYGDTCGRVNINGRTITLTGTPAFSIAYAYATTQAVIQHPACTFVGSATGTRYTAAANGVIFTNSGGATYFPGSVAGSTASGGQYL